MLQFVFLVVYFQCFSCVYSPIFRQINEYTILGEARHLVGGLLFD